MISVIIVAKDKPQHILDSIDSVQKLADEIIIGNLGIDQVLLKKLESNSKIKIININKSVPYVELIREEMKSYAKNDFVLFLDPDEQLTLSLADDLIRLYKKYDFISIPRKNVIFGKWIQHSRWWPDYQTRLFKKSSVIWQKKIHSQPILKGKGFKIFPDEKKAIIHYNYESISEYIEKMNRYAKSQAEEMISKNNNLTLTESLKISISEFVGRYFAGQGYKDGMHGLMLSFLQMFYPLLVYMYSWEHNKFVDKENNLESLPHEFFKQGALESTHWMLKKKIYKNTNFVILKIKLLLQKLFL